MRDAQRPPRSAGRKHGAKTSQADPSLAQIREFFHLPVEEASERLGVNKSKLKRLCREYGVSRWPQRKLQSLAALRIHLRNDGRIPEEELQGLLSRLEQQVTIVLEEPDKPLDREFEDMRKNVYKVRYQKRKQQKLVSGSAAWVGEADEGEEDDDDEEGEGEVEGEGGYGDEEVEGVGSRRRQAAGTIASSGTEPEATGDQLAQPQGSSLTRQRPRQAPLPPLPQSAMRAPAAGSAARGGRGRGRRAAVRRSAASDDDEDFDDSETAGEDVEEGGHEEGDDGGDEGGSPGNGRGRGRSRGRGWGRGRAGDAVGLSLLRRRRVTAAAAAIGGGGEYSRSGSSRGRAGPGGSKGPGEEEASSAGAGSVRLSGQPAPRRATGSGLQAGGGMLLTTAGSGQYDASSEPGVAGVGGQQQRQQQLLPQMQMQPGPLPPPPPYQQQWPQEVFGGSAMAVHSSGHQAQAQVAEAPRSTSGLLPMDSGAPMGSGDSLSQPPLGMASGAAAPALPPLLRPPLPQQQRASQGGGPMGPEAASLPSRPPSSLPSYQYGAPGGGSWWEDPQQQPQGPSLQQGQQAHQPRTLQPLQQQQQQQQQHSEELMAPSEPPSAQQAASWVRQPLPPQQQQLLQQQGPPPPQQQRDVEWRHYAAWQQQQLQEQQQLQQLQQQQQQLLQQQRQRQPPWSQPPPSSSQTVAAAAQPPYARTAPNPWEPAPEPRVGPSHQPQGSYWHGANPPPPAQERPQLPAQTSVPQEARSDPTRHSMLLSAASWPGSTYGSGGGGVGGELTTTTTTTAGAGMSPRNDVSGGITRAASAMAPGLVPGGRPQGSLGGGPFWPVASVRPGPGGAQEYCDLPNSPRWRSYSVHPHPHLEQLPLLQPARYPPPWQQQQQLGVSMLQPLPLPPQQSQVQQRFPSPMTLQQQQQLQQRHQQQLLQQRHQQQLLLQMQQRQAALLEAYAMPGPGFGAEAAAAAAGGGGSSGSGGAYPRSSTPRTSTTQLDPSATATATATTTTTAVAATPMAPAQSAIPPRPSNEEAAASPFAATIKVEPADSFQARRRFVDSWDEQPSMGARFGAAPAPEGTQLEPVQLGRDLGTYKATAHPASSLEGAPPLKVRPSVVTAATPATGKATAAAGAGSASAVAGGAGAVMTTTTMASPSDLTRLYDSSTHGQFHQQQQQQQQQGVTFAASGGYPSGGAFERPRIVSSGMTAGLGHAHPQRTTAPTAPGYSRAAAAPAPAPAAAGFAPGATMPHGSGTAIATPSFPVPRATPTSADVQSTFAAVHHGVGRAIAAFPGCNSTPQTPFGSSQPQHHHHQQASSLLPPSQPLSSAMPNPAAADSSSSLAAQYVIGSTGGVTSQVDPYGTGGDGGGGGAGQGITRSVAVIHQSPAGSISGTGGAGTQTALPRAQLQAVATQRRQQLQQQQQQQSGPAHSEAQQQPTTLLERQHQLAQSRLDEAAMPGLEQGRGSAAPSSASPYGQQPLRSSAPSSYSYPYPGRTPYTYAPTPSPQPQAGPVLPNPGVGALQSSVSDGMGEDQWRGLPSRGSGGVVEGPVGSGAFPGLQGGWRQPSQPQQPPYHLLQPMQPQPQTQTQPPAHSHSLQPQPQLLHRELLEQQQLRLQQQQQQPHVSARQRAMMALSLLPPPQPLEPQQQQPPRQQRSQLPQVPPFPQLPQQQQLLPHGSRSAQGSATAATGGSGGRYTAEIRARGSAGGGAGAGFDGRDVGGAEEQLSNPLAAAGASALSGSDGLGSLTGYSMPPRAVASGSRGSTGGGGAPTVALSGLLSQPEPPPPPMMMMMMALPPAAASPHQHHRHRHGREAQPVPGARVLYGSNSGPPSSDSYGDFSSGALHQPADDGGQFTWPPAAQVAVSELPEEVAGAQLGADDGVPLGDYIDGGGGGDAIAAAKAEDAGAVHMSYTSYASSPAGATVTAAPNPPLALPPQDIAAAAAAGASTAVGVNSPSRPVDASELQLHTLPATCGVNVDAAPSPQPPSCADRALVGTPGMQALQATTGGTTQPATMLSGGSPFELQNLYEAWYNSPLLQSLGRQAPGGGGGGGAAAASAGAAVAARSGPMGPQEGVEIAAVTMAPASAPAAAAPLAHDSYTVLPQGHDSYTVLPQGHDSYTVLPQAGHAHPHQVEDAMSSDLRVGRLLLPPPLPASSSGGGSENIAGAAARQHRSYGMGRAAAATAVMVSEEAGAGAHGIQSQFASSVATGQQPPQLRQYGDVPVAGTDLEPLPQLSPTGPDEDDPVHTPYLGAHQDPRPPQQPQHQQPHQE